MVDVDAVDARINFYAGEAAAPPAGDARIEFQFQGRIYSGRFALEAKEGNQGRTGGGQSHYWSTIDIPAVLGLSAR